MRKTAFLVGLSFWCTILSGLPAHTLALAIQAVHKRALLIGISDYHTLQRDREVPDLHCDEDVVQVRDVLQKKYSFAASDITALTGPQLTTRSSILKALDELVSRTTRGDIVLICYSGLSAPISVRAGAPPEHAIIPSDILPNRSNAITAGELGARVIRLVMDRKAASVVLSMDTCSSEEIAHGAASESGGAPMQAVKDEAQGSFAFKLIRTPGIILMSAAGDKEQAVETSDAGKPMGLYTRSIVRALNEAATGATYRDIFERVSSMVHDQTSEQTPHIDGDVDTVVFENSVAHPQPYIPVSTSLREKAVILHAGSLGGITPGSTFALYARGTKGFSHAKSLATGSVVSCNLYTSQLKILDAGAGGTLLSTLDGCRAREQMHHYEAGAVAVQFPGDRTTGGLQHAIAAVRALPYVKIVDSKPDVLFSIVPGPKIDLKLPDGTLLLSVPGLPASTSVLEAALRKLAVRNRILTSTAGGLVAGVNARIRKVRATYDATGIATVVQAVPSTGESSQGIFAAGDTVAIDVSCKFDAYVTVLDITEDGAVRPVWPDPTQSYHYNFVKHRDTFEPLPFVYTFDGKNAQHTLMVLASEHEVDFSPLLNEMGAALYLSARDHDSTPYDRRRALCSVAFTMDAGYARCLIQFTTVSRASTLRILAVGAGAGNTPNDRSSPTVDRDDVARELELRCKGLYGEVRTRSLGPDASLAALTGAVQELTATCQPKDVFILYYRGGYVLSKPNSTSSGDLLLTPSVPDPTSVAPESKISAQDLKRLLSAVPALHQAVIVDCACPNSKFQKFAGQLADAEDASRGYGLYVMGSTGTRKGAMRSGHGPMADAIIMALRERAAPSSPDDKSVTVDDLAMEINKGLKNNSNKDLILTMDRAGEDPDFPIEPAPPKTSRPAMRSTALANGPDSTGEYHRHGKDYALLIGTDKYIVAAPLRNGVRDVDALEAELSKSYHFIILPTLRNPTKVEIRKALYDLADKQDWDDDQLLIYIAGHGAFSEEQNNGYAICSDSTTADPLKDYTQTLLDFNDLRTLVARIQRCPHILLVLDVCFGGAICDSGMDGPKLASKNAARNDARHIHVTRRILTSGNKVPVSDGDDNSPFCKQFLASLRMYDDRPGILRFWDLVANINDNCETKPATGIFAECDPSSDFQFVSKPNH